MNVKHYRLNVLLLMTQNEIRATNTYMLWFSNVFDINKQSRCMNESIHWPTFVSLTLQKWFDKFRANFCVHFKLLYTYTIYLYLNTFCAFNKSCYVNTNGYIFYPFLSTFISYLIMNDNLLNYVNNNESTSVNPQEWG